MSIALMHHEEARDLGSGVAGGETGAFSGYNDCAVKTHAWPIST